MELWSASILYTFCEAILERPSLADYAALVDGLELDPVFTATLGGSMLLETRGRLALSRGERTRAIAVLEPCLKTQQRMRTGPGHTWVRSTLALALPEKEHERALDLVEEELALTRAAERPRDEGVTLRALGQLQAGQEGLARLEESIALLEDQPAPLELARSCYELGVRLRRSGRRREARVPLARAMDLASRCGAERLVGRANEELHVAGARPRRTAATGAAALTPSERRVARLVAEGHSNAEVAERLFLSMKTVEAHLMKAYRKLGVRGADARARLIAELAEEGAA
jgi:DNA-binding CsgD family transcriptional regulator